MVLEKSPSIAFVDTMIPSALVHLLEDSLGHFVTLPLTLGRSRSLVTSPINSITSLEISKEMGGKTSVDFKTFSARENTGKRHRRQEGLFIEKNHIGFYKLVLPLGLEHLHDDLLLLDEESPHNLLSHGFVAQHSTVSPKQIYDYVLFVYY